MPAINPATLAPGDRVTIVCRECGAPNRKTVLRAFGWWTPACLPATVFKMGGTLYGVSLIELLWRHQGGVEVRTGFIRESCHWVGISLDRAGLCQWCRRNPPTKHGTLRDDEGRVVEERDADPA